MSVAGYRTMTRADKEALAAANRAEDLKRQKALYGKALPIVDWLRPRVGFIAREGEGVRVDSRPVMTFDELEEFARRKGYAGPTKLNGSIRKALVTTGGLRIGDAVPIEKKPRSPAVARPDGGAPRKVTGAAAIAKAKAAEHSTDLGGKPKVVWLDLGLLTVDRRYQRDITGAGQAHINRILRAFNWNRYQPIVVTETADGAYSVIDGQHRLEAAKKHPLIDSLPCYVIDAPDVALQAEIFVSVNSDRRALTGLQKFWASVAAGNREAQALAKACEQAGVTIPRTTPQGGLSPLALLGPNVAVRLIGRLGREAVLSAIGVLAEAWPAARTGLRTSNLAAVATITSTAYSRARLLRALKRLEPDALHAEALALAGDSATAATGRATEKLIRQAMGKA